jgi:hypothetical protein
MAEDRHEVALTEVHYATTLLRIGQKEKANGLLRAALTVFQDLALPREVTRVNCLLD